MNRPSIPSLCVFSKSPPGSKDKSALALQRNVSRVAQESWGGPEGDCAFRRPPVIPPVAFGGAPNLASLCHDPRSALCATAS